MWPYFILFAIPSLLALSEPNPITKIDRSYVNNKFNGLWKLIFFILCIFIGLRHETGGDWFNYANKLQFAEIKSSESGWWLNDPGYRMLEWFSSQMNWGIHGVNFFSASIFSYGLVIFCLSLPRPWLALAVSIPYLVIIVGMGYTRQGLALGCIMAGLVALGKGRVLGFVLWAVIGATFHKSAVVLLPMAALAASQRRFVTAIWVTVVIAVAYATLLEDSVDTLKTNYIEAGYQSQGALIRLLMNAIPSLLLLWRRKQFKTSQQQDRIWFWFAISSIILLGWLFISPSSTAVDRIALYFLPLQLMVFSHLPEVFGHRKNHNHNWVFIILLFYATVEIVWLNFAANAYAWLPYRSYLLVDLF